MSERITKELLVYSEMIHALEPLPNETRLRLLRAALWFFEDESDTADAMIKLEAVKVLEERAK